MKIMGISGLMNLPPGEINQAVIERRLLAHQGDLLLKWQNGHGVDTETVWKWRVTFTPGAARNAAGARRLAEHLRLVEWQADNCFKEYVRHGARASFGITLITKDGRRLVGLVSAIGPEDFTVAIEDGAGPRVTLRFEAVESIETYNR